MLLIMKTDKNVLHHSDSFLGLGLGLNNIIHGACDKGPIGGHYLVEGDAEIRALQVALSTQSNLFKLQLFAVEESENIVSAPKISHYNGSFSATVDALIDGESSEEEEDENEPIDSDYNSDELEFLEREKKREVNEKVDKGQGFKVKTLEMKHTCQPCFKNRRASQQALAHYFKNKVQNNPTYKVTDMRKHVDDKFFLNVSYTKMKRVKRIILEKLDGSFIDDFNKLEVYAQELRDTNPGSNIVINISKDVLVQGKRRFLRMYVSFEALKRGWISGLRPFIGLDGTFLKGKFKGILLVALGQNSMKHFYPLAWAVIDRETARTWKWFIDLLRNSLGLADGEGLTLMSDMQKVMGRLKDLEAQGEKWTENFYPYAMELYNDFKIIAQGCHVQANGDLGYEVVEGIDRHVLQRREEVFQVVPLSAPQPSEESAFMITPGFSASSSQQICQPIDEDEIGDELEVEDEQPLLRPRALYEAKTRLKIKKLQQKPTATRKINFRGDENGLDYNVLPENEDDEREPPMVPTHLHHTVLNHHRLTRDQSAELPSPQHVVLNHLYLENRQVPGSVIAVGATHRFRSKNVTVVLYKPVQRRGGSTNNA
ncbi:SNF1-related protein kinase regulatory subunit beta-3 [Capsicum annuum]|nr:SNF1-related protein kinase regulatory subunit beta-3 [Capsicum annuum]